MFEMVVISGLGQLFRRWYVVGHIIFPGCAPSATISGPLTRLVDPIAAIRGSWSTLCHLSIGCIIADMEARELRSARFSLAEAMNDAGTNGRLHLARGAGQSRARR